MNEELIKLINGGGWLAIGERKRKELRDAKK